MIYQTLEDHSLIIQYLIKMIIFLYKFDIFLRSIALDWSLRELNQVKILLFKPQNRLVKSKFFFYRKTWIEGYLPFHEELDGMIERKIDVKIKIYKILVFFIIIYIYPIFLEI